MGRTRNDHMTIQDNMTIGAADFLKRMSANEPHPPPCECELCLYSLYRKRLKSGKGQPYGRLMFFVNWLIHRIKAEHLIEAGKAVRVETPDGPRWSVKISDYDKAPVSKVNQLLDGLAAAAHHDESLAEVTGDLINIYLHIHKSRVQKRTFIKLINELAQERRSAWFSTQPALLAHWKQGWDDLRLCQKIVDFIRSRPDHKATQRQLERHFSNKRKAELEGALENRGFFPPLRFRKKGKSRVFFWQPPTKAEIEAYNKRVSESILEEMRRSQSGRSV